MDVYNIFPLDPSKIAWNSKIKPKWDVTKFVAAGQGRKTLTHQQYPTWQFDISFPRLNEQERDTLLAFHMFCKGSWNPFFYKDYERHDANVTLKDGETYYYKADGLPLFIPLQVANYVFKEPCYMADNIRIFRDGVEDTSNFEVEADESGTLRVYLTDVETDEGTLQSTVITATYEYYYRVAFQDSITVNEKFKNYYSVSLSLETVKQTITDVGDNDIWQGSEIYNIRIIQRSHQTITVKKIKGGQVAGVYTTDFQMIGSYIIEINVEAESGYLPGDLYINNVKFPNGSQITVTEDLVIDAWAAEVGKVAYINGSLNRWNLFADYWYYVFFGDELCTQSISKQGILNRLILIETREQGPNYLGCLLGSDVSVNYQDMCTNVIIADVTYIKTERCTQLDYAFGNCTNLKRLIGFENWETPYVTSLKNMLYNCSSLVSVDMHDWYTPNLVNVSRCFEGCRSLQVADISGIDTTNVTEATAFFGSNNSLQYVIMDSNDVKFSGSIVMPEGNNSVKYLVKSSMLETYRTHANWSARASRILDIANYNIERVGGLITVTEKTA